MKAAENPNIRISTRSKPCLGRSPKRRVSQCRTFSMRQIEYYQRDKFLDEVNAAFANLRSDPKAWKEEQAERALWDKTLKDGIEPE